jgi:hypothetical protein
MIKHYVASLPRTPTKVLAAEYVVSQSPKWRKQVGDTRLPPEWVGRPDRQFDCFKAEFATFASLYGTSDDCADLPEWSGIVNRRGTPHERQSVWFRAHQMAQFAVETVARAMPCNAIVARVESNAHSSSAISVGVGAFGLPRERRVIRRGLECLGVVAASTIRNLISRHWHNLIETFDDGAKFLHFGSMIELPFAAYAPVEVRLETALPSATVLDFCWLTNKSLYTDLPLVVEKHSIGVVSVMNNTIHVDVYIDASKFTWLLLECAAVGALRQPGGPNKDSLEFIHTSFGAAVAALFEDGSRETKLGALLLEYLYIWKMISLPQCEEHENSDPGLRRRLVDAFEGAVIDLQRL